MKWALWVTMFTFLAALGAYSDETAPLSDDVSFHEYFTLPFVSFIFPGIAQYRRHDYAYGGALTASWSLGLAYAEKNKREFLDDDFDPWDEARHLGAGTYSYIPYSSFQIWHKLDRLYSGQSSHERGINVSHNYLAHNVVLGMQVMELSSAISLYDGFYRAVKHNADAGGAFAFLSGQESPSDLAFAAFRFDYLLRPVTYVPLLLVSVLSSQAFSTPPGRFNTYYFDATAATGAGYSEEMFFRGWMMPLAYHATNSFWSANIFQALIFSGIHTVNKGYGPLTTFLPGLYFGYVTKSAGWKLSQAIFTHFWFDMIANLGSQAEYESKDQASRLVFWLPPLDVVF